MCVHCSSLYAYHALYTGPSELHIPHNINLDQQAHSQYSHIHAFESNVSAYMYACCTNNYICSFITGYGYPAAGVTIETAAAEAGPQPPQPQMSSQPPPRGQPQGYQHPGGRAVSSGPASPVNYALSVRHPHVHMGYAHTGSKEESQYV